MIIIIATIGREKEEERARAPLFVRTYYLSYSPQVTSDILQQGGRIRSQIGEERLSLFARRKTLVAVAVRSSSMFSFPVFVLILLNRCVSSHHDMLPKDVQPCATRSWERVLLDRDEQQLNCSSLPIDIQTSLALHLTFCHLNATGIDPESLCLLSSPSFTLNDCLKNLTTNSFAYLTYTNFLPHIQSICYAVESQRWHSHTRNTILQINTHSNQIETEAKTLLLEQDRLKTSLDQALLVHEHAVDDALHIDRFLQVAQTDVDELRGDLFVKDKAQIELIYQVSRSRKNKL